MKLYQGVIKKMRKIYDIFSQELGGLFRKVWGRPSTRFLGFNELQHLLRQCGLDWGAVDPIVESQLKQQIYSWYCLLKKGYINSNNHLTGQLDLMRLKKYTIKDFGMTAGLLGADNSRLESFIENLNRCLRSIYLQAYQEAITQRRKDREYATAAFAVASSLSTILKLGLPIGFSEKVGKPVGAITMKKPEPIPGITAEPYPYPVPLMIYDREKQEFIVIQRGRRF